MGGGGILEAVSSRAVRPRLTAAQIRSFLPDRGAFTFPAPYGTRGSRITNSSDGMVRPVGMAYWPCLNNSTGHADVWVFVSIEDTLTLFSVDKTSLAVQRLGPMPFHSTGEFCYWSFSESDLLYVPQDNRLLRYNVETHQVDVAAEAPSPITQCHSSYDGRVHSMTLEGGAAVWRNGTILRFPSSSGYDECQVDKSGRWLLIKEGTDNRLIDLESRREFTLTDKQGAVGHSDMGFGYVIGEEDQTDPGGVFRLWLFSDTGPIDGGVVYSTDWTGMSRYVSHCNAFPAPAQQNAVLCSASHAGDVARANELVHVPLDGSGRIVTVCPNLTDLNASGGGEEYWRKCRANIDPTGRYACFSGNMGSERMDVFVVAIPG